MLLVLIVAKVKPLSLHENNGRDLAAPVSVDEGSSIDFLSTSLASGPFASIAIGNHENRTNANGQFSRSTRAHVEFVEFRKSRKTMMIERDDRYPRFRLSTISSGQQFEGDYLYYPDYANDSLTPYNRIYELPLGHSYEGPTVNQLRGMSPKLTLRAYHDMDNDQN